MKGTGRNTNWKALSTEQAGPTGEIWLHRWCRVCKRITQHTKPYGYVPTCDEHDPPPEQRRLFTT